MKHNIVKYIGVVLILCFVLCTPLVSLASTAAVITGGNVYGQVGDTVEVAFEISEAKDICGGNFDISFNNRYLELVSAEAGDALSGAFIGTQDSMVKVAWAGISPIKESGRLVVLRFLIKDVLPEDDARVKIENLKLYDSQANSVSADVTNAAVGEKKSFLYTDAQVSGDKVYVAVDFSGNTDCFGGNFVFNYDSSVVKPVSITESALLSGFMVTGNTEYSESAVKVSWAGGKAIPENGEIFIIEFQLLNNSENKAEFSFDSAKMYDGDSKPIKITAFGCSIFEDAPPVVNPFIKIAKVQGESRGEISVSIDRASAVAGGSVEIGYNSSDIEIIDVQPGESVLSSNPAINKDYGNDVIKLTWAGTSAMNDSGELMKISYELKNPQRAFSVISLENQSLYDIDALKIVADYENGGIAVTGKTTDCATSTKAQQKDGKLVFESKMVNSPLRGRMFIALYKENILMDVVSLEVFGQNVARAEVRACEYDKIKVMVMGENGILQPLSKAEVINFK